MQETKTPKNKNRKLNYIIVNGRRMKTPAAEINAGEFSDYTFPERGQPHYTTTYWTTAKEPTYDYDPPWRSGPPYRMKLIEERHHTFGIPRTHHCVYMGYVWTIVRRDAPTLSTSVTPCHWVSDESPGHSLKLVKGFVNLRHGLHAKTELGLKRMITRHRKLKILERADKRLRKLGEEETQAMLPTTCLPLLSTSQACGNCRPGTLGWLQRLGVTRDVERRKASPRAVYRLARRKGSQRDKFFTKVVCYVITRQQKCRS